MHSLTLLKRLHDGGVEFVLIGGLAAIAHGSSVVTEDVDVCAPLDLESAQRIIRCLQDLHPRWRMRPDLPVVTPDNPNLPGIRNVYLRTDIGLLDVLGEVPGVCTYTELAARSVEMEFEDFRCRVIDLDTLLAAKRVANRPKDQQAIQHLEAMKVERQSRRHPPENPHAE